MVYRLLPILFGGILDFLFGDPYWLPHPIVAIGNMIAFLEGQIRPLFPSNPKGERLGGTVLTVLVPLVSGFTFWLLLKASVFLQPWIGLIVESFMCYQILAARTLATESKKVYTAVESGNIPHAQTAVGRIVGRETDQLSLPEIIKATVETVAENTSDGVVAPLFFLFFGGAPLGIIYKSINTMDSMLGYKNKKYLYFGRSAAYLDDIVNWIPARITGILFVFCAKIQGFDAKEAYRILKRDHKKHKSPNAGYPESAVAGALGIQLGGSNIYHGVVVEKPTLGDDRKQVESKDIMNTNQLMWGASIIALALGSLLTVLWFQFLSITVKKG